MLSPDMKALRQFLHLVLVCCCVPAFAAEAESTGKLESRVSVSQGLPNQVLITETFLRGGGTNFVRYVKVKEGRTNSIVQRVFHSGRRILGIVRGSSGLSVLQEPDIPFRVILEFSGDEQLKLITLFDKEGSMADAFRVNGFLLQPVESQELDAANKSGAELGALFDPEEVAKEGWQEKVNEYIKSKSGDRPDR